MYGKEPRYNEPSFLRTNFPSPFHFVKSRFHCITAWPNRVASQPKFGNANLRTQTCDGWPNGLARRRKFNTSCKKAISVQPYLLAHTKENNTETKLRRLALGGQTVKNLRSFARKFELEESERKSSQAIANAQVMAKRRRKLSQVFNMPDNFRLRLAKA